MLILAATVGSAPQSSALAQDPPGPGIADVSGNANPGGDAEASRNAARSRLRECGHQWSSMKRNGAAAGMTWKDYSRGCLAKQ